MSVFLLCLRNCVKHESTSLPLFFNYLIVSHVQRLCPNFKKSMFAMPRANAVLEQGIK